MLGEYGTDDAECSRKVASDKMVSEIEYLKNVTELNHESVDMALHKSVLYPMLMYSLSYALKYEE